MSALEDVLRSDIYQTKRELADLIHCSPREIEFLVERARKSGSLPIMSGPDGYRLARNPDEYEQNVARRKKRALVQLVTVRGELNHVRRWRAATEPAREPVVEQLSLSERMGMVGL